MMGAVLSLIALSREGRGWKVGGFKARHSKVNGFWLSVQKGSRLSCNIN